MSALPYVYKLTDPTTGEYYFGVRWGNKKPAREDLGIDYFSSSSITKPRFAQYTSEILAEFNDKEDAIDYEQVLIETAWGDPLLLNRAIQVSKTFRCTGHTEETRLKMSNSKKGRPPNNKGKKLSPERVEQMRERMLSFRHTAESKEKIRQKAIGNKRGLGNKSRTGQTQSEEERKKKSIAAIGEKNHFYGKSHTEEAKEKLRAAMKNRPKLKCHHCSRELDPANYAKSHGDKCKSRIDS